MFIDFLYRFVIDHITCYYFRLMAYSIGRKNPHGYSVHLLNNDCPVSVFKHNNVKILPHALTP